MACGGTAGPRVAIVTCRVKPEPDPDEEPLLAALRARGLRAETLAWDDPASAPPADFDLAVLRSPWNYPLRPERFEAWLADAAAATRLLNPLAAVRWNLHKRYLLELAAAGVAAVPTALAPRGPAPDLQALRRERGWDEVVIKPAVSAASFATRRFAAADARAAQAFLKSLCARRDALVQPYLPAFAEGERALVWIAGGLTHAVAKRPRFAGEEESVSGALAPAPEERSFVARLLEALPAPARAGLLYARADLVRGPGGAPLLSEFELVEPSLFLIQHPPALARLADAIADAARA